MKRVLLPVLLTISILLGIPQIVLAKPPRVKLTIEGGSLTKAIEVTDPQILELSVLRGDAKQPTAGLHGYAVSPEVAGTRGGIQCLHRRTTS